MTGRGRWGAELAERGGGELCLLSSFWKCLTAQLGGKQKATNLSLYEWDLEAQRGRDLPKAAQSPGLLWEGVLQYTDDAFPSLCPQFSKAPLASSQLSSGAGFV